VWGVAFWCVGDSSHAHFNDIDYQRTRRHYKTAINAIQPSFDFRSSSFSTSLHVFTPEQPLRSQTATAITFFNAAHTIRLRLRGEEALERERSGLPPRQPSMSDYEEEEWEQEDDGDDGQDDWRPGEGEQRGGRRKPGCNCFFVLNAQHRALYEHPIPSHCKWRVTSGPNPREQLEREAGAPSRAAATLPTALRTPSQPNPLSAHCDSVTSKTQTLYPLLPSHDTIPDGSLEDEPEEEDDSSDSDYGGGGGGGRKSRATTATTTTKGRAGSHAAAAKGGKRNPAKPPPKRPVSVVCQLSRPVLWQRQHVNLCQTCSLRPMLHGAFDRPKSMFDQTKPRLTGLPLPLQLRLRRPASATAAAVRTRKRRRQSLAMMMTTVMMRGWVRVMRMRRIWRRRMQQRLPRRWGSDLGGRRPRRQTSG